MKKYMDLIPGILLAIGLAIVAKFISNLIPMNLLSAGVIALLIGMFINPLIRKYDGLFKGLKFTSSVILKLAIIFMGASLNFTQVMSVGKVSLIVMTFTLLTAFGGGYLVGKLFGMDWRLSSLISAGTGICGGSAIAAIAPSIKAKTSDIAYAISATFLFDILMVVAFPIMGRYLGMSDLGFGLWTGTAVNDTSSVVAAGYAFSEIAGNYSIIVKLTRTLSIVPAVLIFSYINTKVESKSDHKSAKSSRVSLKKIFPWFIIFFLLMVSLKSIGLISDDLSSLLSSISKFAMIMSLGSIGLNTNFKEVSKSGFLPMFHGFIISLLVVVVSLVVQMMMGLM